MLQIFAGLKIAGIFSPVLKMLGLLALAGVGVAVAVVFVPGAEDVVISVGESVLPGVPWSTVLGWL